MRLKATVCCVIEGAMTEIPEVECACSKVR
jgi:hypothetical protein